MPYTRVTTKNADFSGIRFIHLRLPRKNLFRPRGCHRFFFAVVLRLRPALIRASRVLPSTRPLFHKVDRHALRGQFGGFSVSPCGSCFSRYRRSPQSSCFGWCWRRGRRDGLRVDSPSNWLSATAFEKPHSLRHGNRLILQVRNCGNQRSTSICLSKSPATKGKIGRR